jgi:hypothetical protein
MRTKLALVIAALLVVVACKEKKSVDQGASCAAVAANLARIAKGMSSTASDVARCEAEKFPPAKRTCLANAKDLDALAACIPPSSVPKMERSPVTTSPGAQGSAAPK